MYENRQLEEPRGKEIINQGLYRYTTPGSYFAWIRVSKRGIQTEDNLNAADVHMGIL